MKVLYSNISGGSSNVGVVILEKVFYGVVRNYVVILIRFWADVLRVFGVWRWLV